MKNKKFDNVKILYVEDEDFIRENAIEYLNRYFETVYEAKDGLEALDLVKQFNPDIIITDIQMPRLSGLEMAKIIRKENKKTQIIITTGFTDTDYLLQAVELHLVKYMTKPILESKLLPILKQCVKTLEDDVSNIKKINETCTFDTFNKILVIDNKIKKLTRNEILFLELLCLNYTRAISYDEIENYIWYDSSMSGDAIRSLVRALRKKLPENSIDNLSGIGYKINLIN